MNKQTQEPALKFPTMLRKMWSGTEVQKWIDENTHPKESCWISVKDRLPEYLEGKDHSANVLGICKLSETHSYMGIFCLNIVEYTEDGHLWAWAKLDRCWDDLHEGECEFDDDYEITHWMPLPQPPK